MTSLARSQSIMALTLLLQGQHDGDFDAFLEDLGDDAYKNLLEMQRDVIAYERMRQSEGSDAYQKNKDKFEAQRNVYLKTVEQSIK